MLTTALTSLFFASFNFVDVQAQASSKSSCQALIGTCDYYLCLNQEMNCGPDHYTIQFGHHYCEKYRRDQSRFSPAGQAFLAGLRKCLQREIERSAVNTCEDVTAIGFASHVPCYEEFQFCELPTRDRLGIEFKAWREIFNPDLRELVDYVSSCER